MPLTDLDFDTGKPARLGEYPLADKSYAKLVDTVTHTKNAQVSTDLRASLLAYYDGFHARHRSRFYPVLFSNRKQRKLEQDLRLLRTTQPQTITVASLPWAPGADLMHPTQPHNSGLH